MDEVFKLVAKDLNKESNVLHFVIHIDDVNQAESEDAMRSITYPKKMIFYRLLKGVEQALFLPDFFVTPIFTGTTQVYINKVFQASDLCAFHQRLTLLSNENVDHIVTHYTGSIRWIDVSKFAACVAATQVKRHTLPYSYAIGTCQSLRMLIMGCNDKTQWNYLEQSAYN